MKRIGVIITAITDNLQTELLDGVFKTASAADCDVIVLTTMTNALDFHIQTEIMNGEESVYCLLERAELDGVLLASQYFVKENVRRTISEKIRRAVLPCVDLGGSEPFAEQDIAHLLTCFDQREENDGLPSLALLSHFVRDLLQVRIQR